MYTPNQIAKILETSDSNIIDLEATVTTLGLDTRNLLNPTYTLYFALRGNLHHGHDFIEDAFDKGVKNFVVNNDYIIPATINANFYFVHNTLDALQTLSKFHKESFTLENVIGITGSNGKTTIKEWLGQLLSEKKVVKSPKSYNSQTGVPLSLWQINKEHKTGIFEAGISQKGEMIRLQKMIRPDIGIMTNIGDAHAAGFKSMKEKLKEKIILFQEAETIIFNEDDLLIAFEIKETYSNKKLLSWGFHQQSSFCQIIDIAKQKNLSSIKIRKDKFDYTLQVPFSDDASIQNIMHCVVLLLYVNYSFEEIQQKVMTLHNLPMRLEMKEGIDGSIIINDTYNADMQSLQVALDFLNQQAGFSEKMLIISEFEQSDLSFLQFSTVLASFIKQYEIKTVIGIGNKMVDLDKILGNDVLFYAFLNATEVSNNLAKIDIQNKAILIKGARKYQLDTIVQLLSAKSHSVVLETDLHALDHNLSFFSKKLNKNTGVIAVIKASAYGSGSHELGKFLEYKKVAYLAVAFVDEGIALRANGLTLPIMILNPDVSHLEDFLEYNLEPEVYSLEFLEDLIKSIDSLPFNPLVKVHLKLDTGMHRLGFMSEDIEKLMNVLKNNDHVYISSIFTHLSSSEDSGDDSFTHIQVKTFNHLYQKITSEIGYSPKKHVLNTSGILRFPEYHFDLVRLGLGLYGIDSTQMYVGELEKVHTLKAKIIQIKSLSDSDFIGYNRKGKLSKPGQIAIVNIGYADGLMRTSGNGRYTLDIQGKEFPIIGNVCMDLTIVDIGTNSGLKVGDEVIIFGKQKAIEHFADVNHTIPYEILSRISSRVKRIYIKG